MAFKHWYYPSLISGCGIEIDALPSEEKACLRREVTCPNCVARLNADMEICAACQQTAAGAPYIASPHVCDPALA
jgi:ribosomal protein L37AE/L43A